MDNMIDDSSSAPATVDGVHHRTTALNGTTLHYVTTETSGSPVLLLHGFPETWWTFHKLIPLLAERHRVVAVDLRGFGDSGTEAPHGSEVTAQDLRALVETLDAGAVHLVAQDISGGAALRFATSSTDLVRTFTGVEMGLAGYGLEALADVRSGGSWHIGAFATPGVAAMLLAGKEHQFLTNWYRTMTAGTDAVSEQDIEELTRTFRRPDGWEGAAGLYRSMLGEGDRLRDLVARNPLAMPSLAVGGGGGPFTATTLSQVTASEPVHVQIDGVGHHVALEAPQQLATALMDFYSTVD
jgi:pimeloyl-ACP methyl ester carboxylesterase